MGLRSNPRKIFDEVLSLDSRGSQAYTSQKLGEHGRAYVCKVFLASSAASSA